MVGLGLSVGAVLHNSANAQADTARARRDSSRARRDTTSVTVPARPTADSTLRDSLATRDSLHPPRVIRDSIQAPFARAAMPVPIDIGQSLVYDRAALFASGAVTLQDLLDRIPEVTGLRIGWISAPMFSSFTGDIRRVRVFFDGLEYDGIDPRTNQVLDLTEVPIWTLEELRIERGATEVRVYARTWRVDRTTPYTRTDISTGDMQTNTYRGFFGKRWEGGEGLQIGAQQYGTTPPNRSSVSSDQISLMARVGWAKHGWSIDGFGLRTSRNRGVMIPQNFAFVPLISDSIPGLQSSRTDAYFRVGYGDPEHGPWFQAVAGTLSYFINHGSGNTVATATDTVPDTTAFRAQYLLTGGLTAGSLRLEGAERMRIQNSRRLWTPLGRAEFATGPLAVEGFIEGRGPDSLSRAEVTARLTPLSFVSFMGTAGRSSDRHAADSTFTGNYLRAEAAIRLFGLWFGAGVVRRDSSLLVPPVAYGVHFVPPGTGSAVVYRNSLVPVVDPAATGFTARIDGAIYKALKANIIGIRWNDSTGVYRPQYQTRSEIYLQTNWLTRFPSGNFGVLVSLSHEYRSKTFFPVSPTDGDTVLVSVPDSRTLNFHLEIRIVSATLFYQFRNMSGQPYELVPGYVMPRLNQFYGVRWDFWN